MMPDLWEHIQTMWYMGIKPWVEPILLLMLGIGLLAFAILFLVPSDSEGLIAVIPFSVGALLAAWMKAPIYGAVEDSEPHIANNPPPVGYATKLRTGLTETVTWNHVWYFRAQLQRDYFHAEAPLHMQAATVLNAIDALSTKCTNAALLEHHSSLLLTKNIVEGWMEEYALLQTRSVTILRQRRRLQYATLNSLYDSVKQANDAIADRLREVQDTLDGISEEVDAMVMAHQELVVQAALGVESLSFHGESAVIRDGVRKELEALNASIQGNTRIYTVLQATALK